VFKNGASQAVRLPKECRFDADEVCVRRIGSAVLLFPKDAAWDLMADALARLTRTSWPSAISPHVPKPADRWTHQRANVHDSFHARHEHLRRVDARRAGRVFERLRRCDFDEVAISSITLAELPYGVAKSSRPARHAVMLVEFCAPLAILPFDNQAAEAYACAHGARTTGSPIGPLDTLIASTRCRWA